MNKVMLIGRIATDVEYNEEKKYARFSLAINEKVGEENRVYYLNHTCFGKLAEIVKKYVNKGDKLHTEGKIVQNQDKEKRNQISIYVEKIEFLMKKQENGKEDEEFPF